MAKNSIKFSNKSIADLPTPKTGRTTYYDTDITKLALRITSTGTKTFVVNTWRNGKMARITIGKFPETNIYIARNKALEILNNFAKGIDVVATKKEKRRKRETLKELLDDYIKNRDLKESTAKNYQYKLRLGFKAWLNKPVDTITERMIVDRQKWITQNKGKTTANTTCRVLRLTLNYAKALKIIDHAPSAVLSEARLWHKNKRKKRIIPSDQLQTWLDAVNELINIKAKNYLLLALFMGFRSDEALTLEWSNVDLDNEIITLPDPKNHIGHTLPIPHCLIERDLCTKQAKTH